MADNFVDSPMDLIAPVPAGYKGSPGKYDGIPGWPGRTSSPNGVPEKFLEDAMPGVQPEANGSAGYGPWKDVGGSDSKVEPTKG